MYTKEKNIGDKVNYNFHAHTPRCKHAIGTPEEYILKAIEGGITHMGFSDHFPLKYDDGHESLYRVPKEQAEDYVSEVLALREKYKDKINIKIGFEMEYFPALFDGMVKTARSYGAEYLICGQHFLSSEEEKAGFSTVKSTDSTDRLQKYVSLVTKAIQTGIFTYIAHPDILDFVGDEALYRREMQKICLTAKEANVPLEINFLGIREGREYPNELFWKLAGETGAPVTFGFDAHRTEDAADTVSLGKAKALVQKYGLHYIGMPTLRYL